jgi:hypothetical protein
VRIVQVRAAGLACEPYVDVRLEAGELEQIRDSLRVSREARPELGYQLRSRELEDRMADAQRLLHAELDRRDAERAEEEQAKAAVDPEPRRVFASERVRLAAELGRRDAEEAQPDGGR